jgi:hypothetical protein
LVHAILKNPTKTSIKWKTICFFVYYVLKLHLYHFSKVKNQKTGWMNVFLTIFAWWLDDRRIWSRNQIWIRTVPRTNGIRIRETQKHTDRIRIPKHCSFYIMNFLLYSSFFKMQQGVRFFGTGKHGKFFKVKTKFLSRSLSLDWSTCERGCVFQWDAWAQ